MSKKKNVTRSEVLFFVARWLRKEIYRNIYPEFHEWKKRKYAWSRYDLELKQQRLRESLP